MGIVIIIVSCIVLGLGLFLLFKILKWVFHKKVRVFWIFSLLVGVILSGTINRVFFVKMEFIQSKVYPNLYLIKNPVENKNVLNKAIKEKVTQKIGVQFGTKNEVLKGIELKNLKFYEYNRGDWGESGTAYFIENKERGDGMTAELLDYYPEFLVAEYNQQPCKIEIVGYLGKLDYYHQRKLIKTDTLLNSCN